MKLKVKRITRIVHRICEKFKMPPAIVEEHTAPGGRHYVEIRSELTRDGGGSELVEQIYGQLKYFVEAMGGCVYTVWPL